MVNALDNKKGFILWVLCLAQFTLSADVANLSISTSTLVDTFSTDISSIQLLGSIQPLFGAALMLSASMIGLIIGWRRLLIIGATVGFASTLTFLLANDVRVLILVARPLTGIASALILPAVLALVVAHFPGKKRALGFGLLAGSTGLASAITPLLSGWILDHFSWYWPFILVAGLYAITLLGSIFGITPIHTNRPERLDILGMVIGGVSMTTIFFGLIKMPYWGFFYALEGASFPAWLMLLTPVSPAFLLLATGLVTFSIFLLQQKQFETRYGNALLPIRWLKQLHARRGFIILTLMYMVLGGVSFVTITYLQVALTLTTAHSGSIILLFSAFMIAFSVITPLVFKKMSPQKLCKTAFIGMGVAGFTLITSSLDSSILPTFYLGMCLLGAVMGVLASQCPVMITNALGERDAEQSGGLQATMRNIGIVVGITLFGSINQITLDHSIRKDNEIKTYYPQNFVQTIESMPRIPYFNNDRTLSIANEFDLDGYQLRYLMKLNANSRVRGFNMSMILMILISIYGFYISSPLPNSRPLVRAKSE